VPRRVPVADCLKLDCLFQFAFGGALQGIVAVTSLLQDVSALLAF
jgi:hypothetical protein